MKSSRAANIRSDFLFSVLLVIAFLQTASASSVLQAGEDWLKWNEDARVNYVSAYLWGHARGFRDGCTIGQKIYSASAPGGLPGEKCIGKAPQYSKKLEDYAATITEFYTSYAEDKHVPVFMLLDGMSDARNLSIRKMHDDYGAATRHH
jgi:hypothetical protein